MEAIHKYVGIKKQMVRMRAFILRVKLFRGIKAIRERFIKRRVTLMVYRRVEK
jgi:hypothetical protein